MERNCVFAVLAAAALCGGSPARAREVLTLAENGAALYTIAVDDDASPTVAFAARELKVHLDEATGADFPIVTNLASSAGGKVIEVGTRRAFETADARTFGREECAVFFRNGAIAICGDGDAGILYGVYAFLERRLGCRWFSRDGTKLVPRRKRLAVEAEDFSEQPVYPYRWTLLADRLADSSPDARIFLLRNRLNMVEHNWDRMPPATGAPSGRLPYAMRVCQPTVHSLFYYLPPKKHFKDHPEWYSMNKDGKREPRQICFSDAGLREALNARILDHVEKCGGEGYFDLSARDTPGEFCHCPLCKEKVRRYGCVGGPLFDYLFEISPIIAAKYPKANLHFLIYRKGQTQRPPKNVMKFPDNLIGVFAPIDDDFTKPYSHPNNAGTYEDLKTWCRMARVWAWYYPQNFDGLPPHLALSRMAEDTRLARAAGLEGCCYEHDVGTDEGFGFADAISWILTQLYRNPEQDVFKLADEYCRGCYGAAAEDMLGYMRELDRLSADCKVFVRWDERNAEILSVDNLVRWTSLFDKMEANLADDDAARHRVRQVRYSVDIEVLSKWKKIASAGGLGGRVAAEFRDRLVAMVERSFSERMPSPSNQWAKDNIAGMRSKWLERIEGAYLRAISPRLPLPPEFEKVPEGGRLEFFPDSTVPSVKMEDAAYGFAMHESRSEDSHRKNPFRFGVFDYGAVTRPLIARAVEKTEIVPDEFRLYKVGRTKIPSNKCRYWNSYSWRMRSSLTDAYKPGVETEWDVYASLKFTGPAYSEKSVSAKSDVFLDRVVLMKVDE